MNSENYTERISALEQENKYYKETQKKLTRSGKVFKCLRQVNRLIVTEKDSSILIQKTCEYLIKYQNYHNAWIVLFKEDGAYYNSAEAGFGEEFMSLRRMLEENILIECCRLALNETGVRIVNHVAGRCAGCPLCDFHNDRAVMTVRLACEDRIYGTMTVSIPEEYADDEEELELISDIAADLGFALHHLRFEEKSRRFDYILKTLPQTFSYLSTDFKYIAVNDIYSELYNLSLDNVIGHYAFEFIEKDVFDNNVLPMLARCAGGEAVVYDLKINFKTIGTRWMHMNYLPYRDESGNISGIISHGIDITDMKAAESELRKFATISDEALYGTAIADLQGRLVYINKYMADIHGYTPEQLIGQNLSIFHDQNYLAEVERINRKLMADGSYDMLEVWHKHRDGTIFPMLMSGLVLSDDQGEPALVSATALDISAIKYAEKQLIESENKYRHLVETATDIIKQISEDGYITEVNEYTCNLLGWRKDELVGQPITIIDPNFSLSAFEKFWVNIPFNEQQIFETTHQKKDGTAFPVEVHAKKYEINSNVFIMSIARDITDQKSDRKRLVKALQRAEEADKLKSAFLANMSHEIRTPLNGILGFASLMNDPVIPQIKQEQYYDIIVKSGQRLLTTINDLIDISRIESGVVEVELSDIRIDEFLEDFYQFFKPEIEGKSLRFELQMSESGDDAVINSDRDKLYAVIMNLLKNAVKFTNRGSIIFGYLSHPDKIEFYVEDTGNGIPEDKIDAVFNRFIQADLSLTKPFEGSGLGLSISSEYVQMLGGKIMIESTEGMGSRFSFLLPRIFGK